MAMDVERLAVAMIDRIDVIAQSIREGADLDSDALRLATFTAIASAIIDEIQIFAEVNTSVLTTLAVASATALSPGVPGTGTGSGSGTGTIT